MTLGDFEFVEGEDTQEISNETGVDTAHEEQGEDLSQDENHSEEQPEQETEQEAEQSESDSEEAEQSEEDAEEVEKETEQEAKPVQFTEEQNQAIEKIIAYRTARTKARNSELEEELKQKEAMLNKALEYINSKSQQAKEVQEKIKDDDLLPDELKSVTNFDDAPKQEQQSAKGMRFIREDLTPEKLQTDSEYLTATAEIDAKLQSAWGNTYAGKSYAFNALVASGEIPYDTIPLSAKIDSGEKLMDAIITDDNVRALVKNAGQTAKTVEEYRLSLENINGIILSNMLNNKEAQAKPEVKPKPKPKPNRPVAARPTTSGESEDAYYIDL